MAANPKTSPFKVGNVPIGGGHFTVIAGPCAVEDYESLRAAAMAVKEAGASILRGGAFKPRTSPKSFRGLGEKGLAILAEIRRELEIPVITEIMDPRSIERVAEAADVFQIGSRNMHNFSLLTEVGKAGKPVLLKRGMAATEKEFLLATEYIRESGEERIILCERGMRGVDESTRNMLDLAVVPALKQMTSLPVFVDPSHATGRRDLVPAMANAAVAAGADGVMIEVHPNPEEAKCDGEQALRPAEFSKWMKRLAGYLELEGKTLSRTGHAVPS